MLFQKYLKEKQGFVFELDDVIYPQKDYLLQVYYLFAQFIEYGEQINAAEIVKSMQKIYFTEGTDNIFDKIAEQFDLPYKYKMNFDLLLHSARLPLKLLIFNRILSYLQEIVAERKQIFLFTNGDPITQLNKIKQIEWGGLEKYLTVYFAAEMESPADGLQLIMSKHNFKREEVLLIGKSADDKIHASRIGIDFLKTDINI